MPKWIKEVPREAIAEGVRYFLAKKTNCSYFFISRDINGRTMWSVKPGIAVRFKRGPMFEAALNNYPDFVIIEVPKDAETRWRRRQKRHT